MVFLDQPLSQCALVFLWLPIHTEDELAWPDEPFRFTMALQAPLHLERLRLPHQRHAVHPAMTGNTPNALMQMNTVVEVDKIWQVMHARPHQRLPRTQTLPHGGKKGTFCPDTGVSVHTGFSGRDPGKGAHFHRGVTIAAVNTQSAHMMFVAKLDGLLSHNPLFSGIAGPVQRRHEPQQSCKDKHRSQNADARDGVRAWMKDLGHARWLTHPLGCSGPQPEHWAAAYRSRPRVQRRISVQRPRTPPCTVASQTCTGSMLGPRQARSFPQRWQ